jgi:hypothetical protein
MMNAVARGFLLGVVISIGLLAWEPRAGSAAHALEVKNYVVRQALDIATGVRAWGRNRGSCAERNPSEKG